MSCEQFERRLARGELDPVHVEICDACAELAARHFATVVEVPPMSKTLLRSLRDIPRHEVTCRDMVRLYRQAVADERPVPADVGAARHLQQCGQCAALFTVLERGLSAEQLNMSERLVAKLLDLARTPRRVLPVWVRDIRYAAVACYVMAMVSSLVAGEAFALFSETTVGVSTKASEWVDRSESGSRQLWSRVVAASHRSHDFVKAHLEVVREISAEGLLQLEGGFQSSKTYELLIRYLPLEGDNDGTADRQSEEP